MDLSFRKGNRDRYEGQLDLNFGGFGVILEGPLFNKKGSFLISGRRSYLDFVVKSFDLGSAIAPVYGDIQGKLIYDVNASHQISILNIYADDHLKSGQKNAIDNKMVFYGDQNIYQNTIGINWRALWKNRGYSNTSFTYNYSKYNEDFFETGSADQMVQNRSIEKILYLRNVNHFLLNKKNSLEFGFEIKFMYGEFNNWYSAYTDVLGNPLPPLILKDRLNYHIVSGFISYIAKPAHKLTTTIGFRADYYSHNSKINYSPRLSLSFQITDRNTLNASTGLFYQQLPLFLFALNKNNQNLNDPLSIHYILGYDYLLTANTKLSIEIYYKDYYNFPVDKQQASLFLLDEIFYRDAFFFNQNSLVDNGKADSKGIELIIQKKLAKDFYGLVSAAYFISRYSGFDKIYRNRIFDNRVLFSVEGGYKPNNKWEFSIRWIFAGGRPYTPFNIEASSSINRGVLDETRINQERYPAYHSLNVRFDRRFFFRESNLVFYFSVWNAYNRKNVSCYYWNQIDNRQDVIYQWSILPIFGIEFEF
jgi:hypothetical protein